MIIGEYRTTSYQRMSLPQRVLELLNERAATLGVELPEREDDLFTAGILDSFALLDLVAALESECAMSVPDADVVGANFRTIDLIEKYISTRMLR